MFQKALVCTDFKDSMYRLTKFVPSLAAGGFSHIIFFHNVSVEGDREIPRAHSDEVEAKRQQLTDLLREVDSSQVEVSVEVLLGRPSDNILRLIKSKQVDVVFLGSPTRTLLEEKLFGSTTIQLSEKTSVPLVILRPQLISTYTTAELDLRCRHLFQYLLVPYDGSSGSDQLIAQIKRQVQENSRSVLERIRLLWVIDESVRPALRGDHPKQEAQAKLDQVQADLAELGLVVTASVVEGNPLAEIMKAAEAHDIGAIATCSSNLGGFLKWSAPSLTREILRDCWHPVVFFPPIDRR